ncbi:glycosyl hydrolase family 61-domain-containing protein [Mucidula mucida]|nr:glycosyl hydrolase family 61-domain-containing protein [Mucidula mucida]
MFFSLAAASLFITTVAGHATFQQFWIGDVDAGSSCVRTPASNSPVTDVTSADIACNAGAASSSGVCPVQPGESVTVEMHQQPGDRSCANEAIGGNHFGPVIVYMAAVDDATSAVGADVGWFKVSEMGLDNCGHYGFTIPSDIAPGDYLIRAEVIALHSASGANGAQFYPSCYQVNRNCDPDTVSLPGAYDASDPGILINIYIQLDTYTVPGPTLYGTTALPLRPHRGLHRYVGHCPAADDGAYCGSSAASVSTSAAFIEASSTSIPVLGASSGVEASTASKPLKTCYRRLCVRSAWSSFSSDPEGHTCSRICRYASGGHGRL